MPHLKPSPTLKDIQEYVKEMEEERGFSEDSALQKCILLVEEVGELFKVIRKHENIKVDERSSVTSVEEEMADIVIVLSTIANRYNIDLEEAFRSKEEVNKKREWK